MISVVDKRYIEIQDAEFCVGCTHERLQLETDSIEKSDGTYIRNKIIRCVHYSICEDLYDRLCAKSINKKIWKNHRKIYILCWQISIYMV